MRKTNFFRAQQFLSNFTDRASRELLMIAKLRLGKVVTKPAGKDPMNKNIGSGMRSIMSQSEVLSFTDNFSYP